MHGHQVFLPLARQEGVAFGTHGSYSFTNPVRALTFLLLRSTKCTALTPKEYVSTSIQGLVRVRKYKQEGESHGAQARKKVLVKQSKKCSCVPYPVLTPLVARTYPCFACKITGVSKGALALTPLLTRALRASLKQEGESNRG